MKKLAVLALSAAAVVTTASVVSAQGFYFGFGPPAHYEPEPYYAPRYQPAPEPYYRDYAPRPYYGGNYYQRRGSGCQYGWTVQDGVCKPYRGY